MLPTNRCSGLRALRPVWVDSANERPLTATSPYGRFWPDDRHRPTPAEWLLPVLSGRPVGVGQRQLMADSRDSARSPKAAAG